MCLSHFLAPHYSKLLYIPLQSPSDSLTLEAFISRYCTQAPKGTPWMLEMKVLNVSLPNLLSVALPQAPSSSVPLNLWCGAGNFGKIRSAFGQHEIYCIK